MKQIDRAKALFKKYLERTATSEELDEMFFLLQNRTIVEALHDVFEQEWESEDLPFLVDNRSWEEIQTGWEMHQQINPAKHTSKDFRNSGTSWRIAVAAGVLLMVGMSIWLVMRPVNQVFETGYGETLEIVLEDDSRVILNANSRLIWHSGWQNKKERKVELEGEAFFEVKQQSISRKKQSEISNKEKVFMPFKVITPDLTVNVLGTSFNVLARRQTTDVYLKSGEVLLTMNDSKTVHPVEEDPSVSAPRGVSESDSIYLTPGDHVSFSGASRTLERYSDQPSKDMRSWIDGFLVYENDRLRVVLQDLEDIYGKTFEVKDSALLERKVNLGLPYEDWETVAGLMTLSLEIELIETGNNIKVRRK